MRRAPRIRVLPTDLNRTEGEVDLLGWDGALLVAFDEDGVAGELMVDTATAASAERRNAALESALVDVLRRRRMSRELDRAVGHFPPGGTPPAVSVVVCTRDRPDQLRACLDSLEALQTAPLEVLVVDSASRTTATSDVCAGRPVRYVREEAPGLSRARNRGVLEAQGQIVAFTDDDCEAHPAWLDGLAAPFADPLVMVVVGYVGPSDIDTRAQWLFETHGGFERRFEARVFDGRFIGHTGLGDGNSFFRRSVFSTVGTFAEDLGPGTPAMSAQDGDLFHRILAGGWRIAFDPGRVLWHRHRPDDAELRRAMRGYATGLSAFAARAVLQRGNLPALRLLAWWGGHLAGDLRRSLPRRPDRLPLGLIAAEACGVISGPWCLARSARQSRPPSLPRPSEAPPTEPRIEVRAAHPHLSVAIASYNRAERLPVLLAALAEQDYPVDRFEVVLVLDGSTDDSAEVVATAQTPYRLRLVDAPHLGLAATRNRGAREARHGIVVFLDDDIVPTRGFLAAHATAHTEAPRDHVALGYYPPAGLGDGFLDAELRAWWEDYFRRKADPAHQWTFMDLSDGNSSFPRELFFSAGPFDEDFTEGRRQDWELGERLLQQGVPLKHHPQAIGAHRFAMNYRLLLSNARMEGRNDVVLGTKQPHLRARLPLAGWALQERAGPRYLLRRVNRDAALVERMLDATTATAPLLERAGLRGRWRRLLAAAYNVAYLRGLTDVLGDGSRFEAFMAPVRENAHSAVVSVAVAEERPPTVPAGVGRVDLEVADGSTLLARVEALGPGEQWDWSRVRDRILDATGYGTRW